jgi:hypothetical protein
MSHYLKSIRWKNSRKGVESFRFPMTFARIRRAILGQFPPFMTLGKIAFGVIVVWSHTRSRGKVLSSFEFPETFSSNLTYKC